MEILVSLVVILLIVVFLESFESDRTYTKKNKCTCGDREVCTDVVVFSEGGGFRRDSRGIVQCGKTRELVKRMKEKNPQEK